MQVYLQGAMDKRKDMEALLEASGASQLARPPPVVPAEDSVVKELQQGLVCPTVVVLHSGDMPAAAIKQKADAAGKDCSQGIEHVRCTWLLDSAAAWVIQPFVPYRVQS